MGNYIPNLCVVDGLAIRLPVRKKVGETYAEKAGRVAAFCLGQRKASNDYFAIRYAGGWHIYQINYHVPKLSGLSEAAAAMWLMHRSTRA